MSIAPGGTHDDFYGPDWRDEAVDAGWFDPDDFSPGALAILCERERQEVEEGWKPAHDDRHVKGEMACAAACYCLGSKWNWPSETWDDKWWKPSEDKRRDLVKAGALIAAEIDRLDRIASRNNDRGGE